MPTLRPAHRRAGVCMSTLDGRYQPSDGVADAYLDASPWWPSPAGGPETHPQGIAPVHQYVAYVRERDQVERPDRIAGVIPRWSGRPFKLAESKAGPHAPGASENIAAMTTHELYAAISRPSGRAGARPTGIPQTGCGPDRGGGFSRHPAGHALFARERTISSGGLPNCSASRWSRPSWAKGDHARSPRASVP